MLLEAASQVGGQVVLAARANERQRELLGIIDWLAAETRRIGVGLRLNCFADAEDVLSLDPDVVIVATGGSPAIPSAIPTQRSTHPLRWRRSRTRVVGRSRVRRRCRR